MSTPSPADSLLLRLSTSDEAASLALLAQFCRQCPPLRRWLWGDFRHDATARRAFAQVVDDPAASFPERFIDLSDSGGSWREEQRRLRAELPTRPYGGLSRAEIETLIRRFQAGSVDLGTFLLAHDWDAVGAASPALVWAGVAFLDVLLPARDWRAHRQLAKAFTFLRRFGRGAKRRAAFSYADWWKVRVLFYVLRHPQPSYRTRELRAHLATLGVEVSTKDMRRFCSRHGIRRDMRAGRPRKAASEPATTPARRTHEQRGRQRQTPTAERCALIVRNGANQNFRPPHIQRPAARGKVEMQVHTTLPRAV